MKNPLNAAISLIKFFPHIIAYKLSKNKDIIDYEVKRWNEEYRLPHRTGIVGVIYLLRAFRPFRTLFYFRTGAYRLQFLARGENNLEFYTPSDKIGKGLVIWHGFSTVINVREMGEDCQVWQNVTIGKKTTTDYDDRPIIGAGTKICAGAIVAGEIEIAPNVTVGAGAVVVKDVKEPGTVVVSSPARYIIK